MEKLLNVNDICEIFGCAKKKAYKIMKDPEFPSFSIGKTLYVRESDLEDYLDNKIVQTTNRKMVIQNIKGVTY